MALDAFRIAVMCVLDLLFGQDIQKSTVKISTQTCLVNVGDQE